MNRCEQLLWLMASLIALAIVAHRRDRSRKHLYYEPEPYEVTEYEGTHSAPCAEKRNQTHPVATLCLYEACTQQQPRPYEMPLRALTNGPIYEYGAT